jgi:hypothetical protein
MNLYSLNDRILDPIDRESFDLERTMQALIENNVESLFELEFISTEFTVGDFRLDSLCFNNETNSFVIIEYKRGSSYSVIDQGYSYMSTMLNNKADFVLEYIEKTGTNLKKDEVDWSQSRIIFISPSFSSYQKNSINFKDVPFELWEITKFSNNIVSLNQHISTSNESIQKIEGNKNSVIKNVGREVKAFDEKDHTKSCGEKLLKKWEQIREAVLELDGVDLVAKRNYISLMLGGTTVAYFNFKVKKIIIGLQRGNLKVDGSKSKHYFEIDDPKNISSEHSWTWKSGTTGTSYKIPLDEKSDIDYLVFLVRQKHKNVSLKGS